LRPIKLLINLAAFLLLFIGIVALFIGFGNGMWWVALIFWGLSALVAWIGRKVNF
jgi:membrane protein implicated in regulation of membrane protease activity